MNMKSGLKTKFTLIELLVVIGIIAILMGMLLPAVIIVQKNANKAKARTQITALETAIKLYESEYGGVLPWGGGADTEWDDFTATDDDNYDTMLQILTKVNMTSGDATSRSTYGNARNLRFLDAPSDFATAGYVDPWGNRFVASLDLDYDGDVTVASQTLYRTIAIYSFGPDGNDDDGVSSGTDKDDINSWE